MRGQKEARRQGSFLRASPAGVCFREAQNRRRHVGLSPLGAAGDPLSCGTKRKDSLFLFFFFFFPSSHSCMSGTEEEEKAQGARGTSGCRTEQERQSLRHASVQEVPGMFERRPSTPEVEGGREGRIEKKTRKTPNQLSNPKLIWGLQWRLTRMSRLIDKFETRGE